jgi:hypothetical protein
MAFATITGRSLIKIPYNVQRKMPEARTIYIEIEMSFVSFDLMVFIT